MIGLIVAYTRTRTIGNNGCIPWNIKGEQRRFRELTTNHVVIMGRRSYEEIGKPLKNRMNIVISSTKKFEAENLITVSSLEQALELCKEKYSDKNIYIAGGAMLYKEAMDLVDVMYITEVNSDIDGDTKFPEFDENLFTKTVEEFVDDEIPYAYVTFTRKAPVLKNIADLYMKETLHDILFQGYLDENPRPHYADGTPAHTLSINQKMYKYDLSKGEFPLGTLRPQAFKSGLAEILWIYQKQTSDLKTLDDMGVTWWHDWESKDRPGTIGQRYGATVKKHNLIDQLLDELVKNPFGRRHIISLWQEHDFKETDGLMPCAFQTIWNVRKARDGKYYLDMTLTQRSSDWLTAGMINQCQYVCLLLMVARHCGYEPGVFCHFVQNVQIYDRHMDAAKLVMSRSSVPCHPRIVLLYCR